jgi:hypothetical protein
MELDDLLKEEGLDAAGVEDALAWARRRAAELVRDVGGDPELGPLLDAARVVANDVEDARAIGEPIVVHAPAESSGREARREPEPEPEPEPRIDDASPTAAAFSEEREAEDDRAAADEEHGRRPAAEPDVVRPRAGSPSARAEAAQSRPMFADLRGLQAAFLAENEDEDDELPEVGAVLRAFQKGKGRSGSVRSASVSEAMRAAKTTPVDTIDARPAPTSGPQRANAAVIGAAREPDAPVPRRRVAHDVTPPRASAELVAARPAEGWSNDREAGSDIAATRADVAAADVAAADVAAADVAAADVAARGEDEATAPGASQPVAPDDEAVTSDAADHGLPAPPEADLDPLAGIDFDDLPGVDEDDEEEDHTHVDLPMPNLAAPVYEQELEARTTMVPMDGPDLTLPSMQMPLAELLRARAEGALPASELTERALNPLLSAEPTGEGTVTAMAPNPLDEAAPVMETSDVTAPTLMAEEPADEPAEDIELLDDEDLLLVEEDPQDEDDDDEVPEWKRALLESKSDDDDER